MNMNVTSQATAIEKYKNDIIQFMVINPESAIKKGVPDSVNITDFGKLLYDLSKAGNIGSSEIIANLMAGRQDENLENFLQAYCYIYGYDFSYKAGSYDRYGNGSYGDYYAALKKYLSTFGDYLLDEPDDDTSEDDASEEGTAGGGFTKYLRKRLKKFSKYFKS